MWCHVRHIAIDFEMPNDQLIEKVTQKLELLDLNIYQSHVCSH